MQKKTVGIMSILSILFSPLLGGLIGKALADSNIFELPHLYLDAGLVFAGIVTWIVASVMFYIVFKP